MAETFSALEARTNRAVLRRLANAMAVVGADEFPVIFDADAVELVDGMADASGPRVTALATDVAALQYGSAITVGGTAYSVARARPDGEGWTALQLRKTA